MEFISPPCLKAVSGLSKCNSSRLHKASNPITTAPVPIPLLQSPPKLKPKSTYPPKIEIKSTQPQRQRTSNNNNSSSSTSTSTTDVLRLMDGLHLPIPPDIYSSLLKECTDRRDAVGGAEVHAHIARSGRRLGLLLANRLLLMHAACGHLDAARQLFDKMTIKDSISWATMIAGHVDNHEHEEALILFKEMQQNGLNFTNLIIACILKACIHTSDFGLGKQVHGWVLKNEHSSCYNDLLLGSSLIHFYGKFRCLQSARCVFDQMCPRDTVIWTAMIVGYCREEHFDEVLEVFKEMGRAGTRKNNFTFSSVLRACGRMSDKGRCGTQVHANAIKLGVGSDLFVRSSLVDMYGKCGLLQEARRVFETICSNRNAVCWNAMLTGYMQHGFYNEAIKFLYKMKAAGVQPQESMLNEVRIACGS